MTLPKERIYFLLQAYISKQSNAQEEKELMGWLLEAEEDSELKTYMLKIWNDYQPAQDLSYVNWDVMYSRMLQSLVVSPEPKVRKINWTRLVAAAVIIGVLGAGIYLYLTPPSQQSIATVQPKQNDISAPIDNKAVLTLADGTKIRIDSSGNGTLATQGNMQIIKNSNGEISYSGTSAGEVGYNTINVPRGSKSLRLVLADGSQVWINVGSSLTYPTAFTGKERKVRITGEAYFEVAKNARMPFLVQHNDVSVSVLGTHFNVNTYEDEVAGKITLLEGSVRVNKSSHSQLLKPGQQASLSYKGFKEINVINNVDLDEVMAWKDGKFIFGEMTDISAIMREISRWYNVDIEYQGKIDQHFWGSISKDVNVSQVLKVLEATGSVKFKVEENKIIVLPVSS